MSDTVDLFSARRGGVAGMRPPYEEKHAVTAKHEKSRLILCCGMALWAYANLGYANDVSQVKHHENYRDFSPGAVVANTAQQQATGLVGVIYPNQRFLLSMSVSGLVSDIDVKEGDFVEADSALVVLQQDAQKFQLERLEQQQKDTSKLQAISQRVVFLRERLGNAKALYEGSRSISLDDLNTQKVQLIEAEGELKALELTEKLEKLDVSTASAELKQRTLYAPSKGYISKIKINVGEWAQAGDPILELVDSSVNFIRINIPNHKAMSLTVAQEIKLQVEDKKIVGRVKFISPVADPSSGLVEVKIEFDNPNNMIRPGLKAQVFL